MFDVCLIATLSPFFISENRKFYRKLKGTYKNTENTLFGKYPCLITPEGSIN